MKLWEMAGHMPTKTFEVVKTTFFPNRYPRGVEGDACILAPVSVPKEKNHKVTDKSGGLGGQTVSARKERRFPGNSSLRFPRIVATCELLNRLVGTRILLLHGPLKTSLTLVGGRSRLWESSDLM
ncbi:hypothetical protein TNCV_413691 [Trichonephila clavipes]|nr:hypothetical protein TNCV_413691 [Trichonephila clavipes]